MILVTQSEFQKSRLLVFGSKAVCIDTTHNLTDHDFKLVTIAILDGHNEAIPVAWLITGREDELALLHLFKRIRENCREESITPATLMSDMANNFYQTWCKVFNEAHERLFCAWHVNKAWRD